MYIPLKTFDVWTAEGAFSPVHFFEALPLILKEGDILVFGAYEPSQETNTELLDLGARQDFAEKVYFTTFELNRRDHPKGRPYELPYSSALIPVLCDLAGQEHGQNDKQLFFDHFLGFRQSLPLLPLFDFHGAFHGGSLYISDHYAKETISTFAEKLGSPVISVENPAHMIVSVEPGGPANAAKLHR